MDSQLKTKIHHVIIDYPEIEFSIVRTFAAKPAPNLEKRYGRLFGLIEIKATDATVQTFIDYLIDQLKNNYYQQSTPDNGPADLEHQFETALQKTNVSITTFLETESVSLKVDDINATIGVIADQQLVFTQLGNINIFLLQYLKHFEYRMIDILEATKTIPSKPNPLKIFSQVINGRIRPKDIILLTTSNVFDYFSLERIRSTISEATADRKSDLHKLFQNLNTKENFGLLTIELEKIITDQPTQVDIQKIDYVQAASKDSMKGLIRTEQETQKLLTPSILPEIKKYAQVFSQATANYLAKIKNTSLNTAKKTFKMPQVKIPAVKIPTIKTPKINLPTIELGQKISRNWQNISRTARPIKNKTYQTIRSIRHQPIWQKIGNQIINGLKIGKRFYYSLPQKSRRLLTIVVVLVLVFTVSLTWLGLKNARAIKIQKFNQTIAEAELKKNESEASLIYRDENQARLRLIEAKNLLASLNPTNNAQKQQITDIDQAIEEQLARLRYIIEVNEPLQIVNFKNLDDQADIAPVLIQVGQTVYTQNKANQSIYKANLDTRIMSSTLIASLNTGNFKLGTRISNQEILFFNETKNVFKFNPSNDAIQPIVININSGVEPVGAAQFNGRLYILDPANNQIYRYDKTSSGYGGVNQWINDNRVDLSNAVDLTIDGSIFVLKADGQIIKLEAGQPSEFNLPIVDPAFVKPTRIKTSAEENFIYVLDPPTKRLVVFDKTGKLINQYISEQFIDLKDFTVDQAAKRIYLLNDSTIFGFSADHL